MLVSFLIALVSTFDMYVYGKIITNTTIKFVLSYMALTTINHINHSCFFQYNYTCMNMHAWRCNMYMKVLTMHKCITCRRHTGFLHDMYMCKIHVYIYIYLYVHVCEYNLTIIYVYKLLLRNLIKIENKKIPTIFDLFSFGGGGTWTVILLYDHNIRT